MSTCKFVETYPKTVTDHAGDLLRPVTAFIVEQCEDIVTWAVAEIKWCIANPIPRDKNRTRFFD